MCEADDFVERAYTGGTAMGGDLGNPPDVDAKPRFAAAALRDPEGNLLQRLQIIKGWIDASGGARSSTHRGRTARRAVGQRNVNPGGSKRA